MLDTCPAVQDESLSPESPEKCKGPELRASQSHGEDAQDAIR